MELTFYLAKILDINETKFSISDDTVDDEMDDIAGRVKSMKINVHYDEWSDKYHKCKNSFI